uniref:Uncharacterized protein n=1 Tax=Sexangularia sp. CB-2014 TaxID=1486929 RepID=A0A7S1V948_9EUKA
MPKSSVQHQKSIREDGRLYKIKRREIDGKEERSETTLVIPPPPVPIAPPALLSLAHDAIAHPLSLSYTCQRTLTLFLVYQNYEQSVRAAETVQQKLDEVSCGRTIDRAFERALRLGSERGTDGDRDGSDGNSEVDYLVLCPYNTSCYPVKVAVKDRAASAVAEGHPVLGVGTMRETEEALALLSAAVKERQKARKKATRRVRRRIASILPQ